MKRAPPAEGLWTEQVIADSTAEDLWPGATQMIRQLNWGLLQKTQIRKMPSFPVVARTPFWSFCAGQRRIGPGQITDGT